MPKLTFDEALERLNEERCVSRDDVLASALARIVWVSEWHLPGCLSESRGYHTTKTDAVESALDMAAGENGPPRGMKYDLRRLGRSDKTAPDAMFPRAITTVTRYTLSDLI